MASIGGLAAVSLSACAGTVTLEPAQHATEERCAYVSVRFPTEIDGQQRRETSAQATAAYGSPASVVVHCGVPEIGPTSDRCLSISGVDWIEQRIDDDSYRYTTYGRSPALEAVIDTSLISGDVVLAALGKAAVEAPSTGGCLGPESK